MHRHAAAFVAIVCAAGSALGDVTATGEFTGEAFETFENVAPPGGYPGPLGIFGGNVTLDDSVAHTVVIAFNWLGPAGEVLPLGGNLMGGIPAGTAVFEFSTPVERFGGYFNTVGLNGGGTAVFHDGEGNEIGSLAFGAGPVDWVWAGWESDVGISTIELTGNNGVGFGFQFDNLTLNYIPAPGTIAPLAIAGLAATRRRR